MATAIPIPSSTPDTVEDWQKLIAWNEKQQRGLIHVSLTNMTNTSAPSVAAGSIVEVNGSGYYWGSDEAVSGTPAAGSLNYIKMVADTPTWTTTAPTWSASKGGWYDGNDRYIGGCYYDGTNYANKFIYNMDGDKIYENRVSSTSLLNAISYEAQDLTLSSNYTQDVIYCKDLHITASITLTCQKIVAEGNVTIDSGATVTVESPIYATEDSASSAITRKPTPFVYIPSKPDSSGDVGGGCLGGCNGVKHSTNDGKGGGGSITEDGGGVVGEVASTKGLSGVKQADFSIGGAGGNANASGRGGGGAGPGAGGGGESGITTGGGAGGPLLVIICKGNFTNSGTITCNGSNGADDSGGGGGGMFILFAYGSTCTIGTIQAIGGSPSYGGGGGGGHIHIIGHSPASASLSVSGGSGGNNGATGTTHTTDLDTDTEDDAYLSNASYAYIINHLVGGIT
jgi:hypothetical protein